MVCKFASRTETKLMKKIWKMNYIFSCILFLNFSMFWRLYFTKSVLSHSFDSCAPQEIWLLKEAEKENIQTEDPKELENCKDKGFTSTGGFCLHEGKFVGGNVFWSEPTAEDLSYLFMDQTAVTKDSLWHYTNIKCFYLYENPLFNQFKKDDFSPLMFIIINKEGKCSFSSFKTRAFCVSNIAGGWKITQREIFWNIINYMNTYIWRSVGSCVI